MPSDLLTLGLDTSAAHCAAALLSGERLLAQFHEEMATGQAERLMPMVEAMLRDAGAGWDDIAVLGAGIGPGNFTGVRITVAAARGLALALKAPAVGVSGFEALACGRAEPVLVSLDARRGQSYLAIIGGGEEAAPLTATPESLPEGMAGSGLDVIGHEAERFAAVTGGRACVPAMPLAEAIARRAHVRRHKPGPRPAPLYLRRADAAPPSDPPPALLP
ncbi:tRNA (adenosine(37)-N6)-threonylcarbamoyltransferase complex dimerization subunit type 1 TsaB [Rhodobacteraceae bacterium WD3A24]|nr:tRNA (adenosine(37)-N6)-threonylcarbamoyltransferase complex dimerization subunit type 1 TsaB [Rhodobacteraceae bacterium WD3A24]